MMNMLHLYSTISMHSSNYCSRGQTGETNIVVISLHGDEKGRYFNYFLYNQHQKNSGRRNRTKTEIL